MGRVKKRPDLENAGINPFTSDLIIKVNKKHYNVMNKFDNPDKLEFTLEATPYCKVFEIAGCKQKMIDLPIRAKELLLYLIHSIDGAMDIIWIPRTGYMESNSIRSVNTFKEAVKALADQLYIYPHASLKDVYWINPNYFFKGDRIRKYPNNVRIK